MNIHSFAKRYRLPLSTVRYYIKTGLLIPDSIGNRYEFTQATLTEMDLICKLKSWHFSLADIASVMAQARICYEIENHSKTTLKEIYEKNYHSLLKEKQELEQSLHELQLLLESLNTQEAAQEPPHSLGVDTIFLPFLYCPACNLPLTILPKAIRDGQIHHAHLHCDCGYHATIEDGIVCIPKNSVECLFSSTDMNRNSYKNLNENEINHIYKLERWLFNHLENCHHKQALALEIAINDYCFLYSQAERLHTDVLYIISDCSLDLIKKYKQRMEHANEALKVLYIAGDNIALPIKKQCVDIYIDFFKNNNYAKYNDHFLFKEMAPYLHSGSYIIGAFPYVKPHGASAKRQQLLFPLGNKYNYNLNAFLENQHQNGIALINSYSNEAMKNSSLSWHVDGDELRHFCYCATVL